MVLRRIRLALVIAGLSVWGLPACAQTSSQTFSDWLADVRTDAVSSGVQPDTVDRAFANITLVDRVIQLDRRQPEFVQTFWQYMDSRINQARVDRGQALLAQNNATLNDVTRRYGVPATVLVAFWALESNYGATTGDFPAVSAIATLGYDGRRGDFFRQQLLALLRLMDRGDVPIDARSSWAGALGQMQFIPTTYESYAVDFDGDGRRDLWGSLPDIFASASNLLVHSGWHGEAWGREVLLPVGADLVDLGLEVNRPMSDWRAFGLMAANGETLDDNGRSASLILPAGVAGGPAILADSNFQAIMQWNRSMFYAVSVGYLADRIAGAPPFFAPRPAQDKALSRTELVEMQSLLVRLGFDTGGTDGIVGSRTRDAIRSYQQMAHLPADGYPSDALLAHLRAAVQ